MRRFTLILLLLGMLLAVGIVGAQEEEIIVSYYTNDVSDSTPYIAQAFLEEVQTQLLELGISITVVWHSDFDDIPENSNADMLFYSFLGAGGSLEDTSLSISAKNKILETISPVLESSVLVTALLSDVDAPEITMAVILYTIGRNEDALEVLNIINPREDNIDRAMIEHLAGNIYIARANYEAAINHLKLSTTEFANNELAVHEPYLNLAWVYITTGETEIGIEVISSYIDFVIGGGMGGEGLYYLWAKRAQLYALAFDYDSAITDIDRAIVIAEEYEMENTRLAELYTIRGEIIFLIYEWDRVLENFNHAIQLDPNYAPAYFQRGILYYTMTQRENALADFQHYLELEPDGLYAEEAAQYIESIEIELEALGG